MPIHAYGAYTELASQLLLGQNDIVVDGAGATVTGNYLFGFEQFGHSLTVAGSLAAGGIAVILGNTVANASSHVTTVTAGGVISGFVGIAAFANDSQIFNAGTITGIREAISHEGTTAGTLSILNSGLIASATSNAIWGSGDATTSLRVENTGTLAGGNGFDAIEISNPFAGDDVIINSGEIRGDVRLGGGNDLFETRANGTVLGSVFGEAGNDRFVAGRADETFYGGAGADTLDLRLTGGQTVSLDGSVAGTGVAARDTYVDIEFLRGSLSGADNLFGSAAGNQLFGYGGGDRLNGRAGSDVIEGGAGIDTLTGGSGNDSFVFRNLTEIGDAITDFSSSVTANDDRFLIRISGFGISLPTGLLTGDRFVARADNVAQDTLDRFIFRTTDTTLWFDRDGTGGSGPVMVANLQAGATMTAADISII